MPVQGPWRRVKDPADLPAFRSARDLDSLDEGEFAAILRDHLIPRSQDRKYNSHWRNFWNVVGFDATLSNRADSILDQFISDTKAALEAAEIESAQEKRASIFVDRCVMAQDRLDKADDEPLSWAGARAAQFNPRARTVIDQLTHAIAQHRRDHDDEKLWRVLRRVGLDPDEDR